MDYYDDDDWAPWYRRRSTLTVLGALATLTVLTVLLIAQPWAAQTSDNPAPPSASGEGADDDPVSSSRCGLPNGDQTIPASGPSADWLAVDQLLVPVSPDAYGPAADTNGIYSCFARNPRGAIAAAAMDLAQRGSVTVDAKDYIEARYARTDNYERELAQAVSLNPDPSDRLSGEVVAFRVFGYSSDRAQVEVVARVTGGQLSGELIAAYYDLQWSEGDWRIIAPDDVQATLSSPDTLAAHTEWPAAPPADSAEPGVLPRAAPAWAMTSAVSTSSENAAEEDSGPCQESGWSISCGVAVTKLAVKSPGTVAGLAAAAPGAAVDSAASAAADSAFEGIALSMVEAQEWALEKLLTAWLVYPDPDLQGEDSTFVWLQDQLQLFVVFITLGAVLVAAYRLVTTGRFEHLGELGMVFGRVILAGGLVGGVVTLSLEIGDMFSTWILAQVEFELDGIFTLDAESPAWIILIAGAFVVLVQIFQFAIMIFRYGAVLYLCAAVIMFAAASNTRIGKQGWEKSLAWLLAFVFYKPVAALIYALAIKMTNGDRSVADQVAGIAMTALALVALPAMMRLIAPHTAALGGANAGALAGATVGAAVATGAVLTTAGGAAASGGGGGLAGFSSGSAATVTGGGSGGGAGGASTGGAGGGSGGSSPSGSTPPGPSTAPESRSGSTSTTGSSGGSSGDSSAPGSGGAASGADGSGEGTGLASTVDSGRGASSAPASGATPQAASAAEMLRGAGSGASAGRRAGGVADGAVEPTTEEEQR